MGAKLGPGSGDANAPAAISGARDIMYTGNFLQVDQVVGRDHPGAQLHQNVRSAGKETGDAGRRGCGAGGIFEGFRRVITHCGTSSFFGRS